MAILKSTTQLSESKHWLNRQFLFYPQPGLAKRPDLSNSVNCCGFGFDYLCTDNIDVAIGWLQARGILRGAGAMVLIA